MSTVYLESSIIGYLTSRPSRDLIAAGNQQVTHDWWRLHRTEYDLFVSEAVVAECGEGDPEAAQERLDVLGDIPILDANEDAEALAGALVRGLALPRNARVDALHIGIATVNGMDFLLTWNCTHIANAAMQHRIEAICRSAGFEPPTICTPPQLMEA